LIRPALIVVSTILVAGCATTYSDLSGLSPEQIADNIEGQSSSVKTFNTEGYGNFETPEGSFNATFDLWIQKPFEASIRLYGPFGIKVAQARLTDDTIIVYNSLKNEVYVGRPTPENIRRYLMIASDGSTFSEVLLGFMVPLAHLRGADVASHYDGKAASFTYASEDTVEKFVVDGHYLRTTEYEQLVDGEEVLSIHYSNFTKIDEVYFPRSIAFEDIHRQISARLFYQDIALNENDALEFNVPADAKEIILN